MVRGCMGWSPGCLLVLLSSEDGWIPCHLLEPIPWRSLGFAALQESYLLCLLAVLGVPSCQTQCKGLLKRLFAKDEELEMQRDLLQSLSLPNICPLPLVRSANEPSRSVQMTVIHLSPIPPSLFKCSCRNHNVCALLLCFRSHKLLFLLGFCSLNLNLKCDLTLSSPLSPSLLPSLLSFHWTLPLDPHSVDFSLLLMSSFKCYFFGDTFIDFPV